MKAGPGTLGSQSILRAFGVSRGSAGTKEQNGSLGGRAPNVYSQVAGRHEELICILWCPCSLPEDRTTVLCVHLLSEKASLIT